MLKMVCNENSITVKSFAVKQKSILDYKFLLLLLMVHINTCILVHIPHSMKFWQGQTLANILSRNKQLEGKNLAN